MAEYPTLRYWLEGIWRANGRLFFEDEDAATLTGTDVRGFVAGLIDAAPISSRPKRHLWVPLTPDQKRLALEAAFPEAEYRLPDDGPERG